MKKHVSITLVAMVGIANVASAAVIGLSDSPSYEAERTALVQTLTELGHTVTADYAASDLVMSISGIDDTSVVDGKPYIQLGDWGASSLSDSYVSVTEGSEISIAITGSHAVFNGLDSSWTSYGFHHYGYTGGDFLGYVTDQDYVDATYNSTVYGSAFAINDAGDQAYFGWSVYGSDANENDVTLLSNTVNYMIPEPASIALISLFGFGSLAVRRIFMI